MERFGRFRRFWRFGRFRRSRRSGGPKVQGGQEVMAVWVVEFSNGVYKIRNIFE